MSTQFVDWGTFIGMLGLATFLWRMMANQKKDMNRRFDRQDGRFEKQGQDMNERFDKQDADMAELKTDMAVVKNDLGHVKNNLGQLRDDFGHLRSRCDRMDANIVQMMRDVGRLEGRQQSSSPKEKVGVGGS